MVNPMLIDLPDYGDRKIPDRRKKFFERRGTTTRQIIFVRRRKDRFGRGKSARAVQAFPEFCDAMAAFVKTQVPDWDEQKISNYYRQEFWRDYYNDGYSPEAAVREDWSYA